MRGDLLQVDLAASHALQRPVSVGWLLAVKRVGPPEPLVREVAETRGEAARSAVLARPAFQEVGKKSS